MIENKFNCYHYLCPSRNVLEIISDKWSILVITLLTKKVFRFGELKREIGGISPKMLTQTLVNLERYGLILRQPYPVLPLKVEYSLSELGVQLSPILNALTRWTEENMHMIMAAEKTFIKN